MTVNHNKFMLSIIDILMIYFYDKSMLSIIDICMLYLL